MKTWHKILYALAVLVFLTFSLGPLIWTLIISLTPEAEMLKNTPNFLPSFLYWGNYKTLFDTATKAHMTLFSGLKNSALLAFITVALCLPISVISAYIFYRFQSRWKNTIFKLMMMTIVIPVFTTIIPLYAMFARYQLLDQHFWIAIIYVTAFLPINTWMIYNHYQTIPADLIHAGQIDGANELIVFWDIILPLSMPIVVTSALTIFLMSWSQFQIPLILTTSQAKRVTTLVLSDFMTRDSIQYGMIAASGLVSIIPPALMAILFRRNLTSGLTAGSVKM